MKFLLYIICIFSFAFAEAQTPTIKVKKKSEKECDCQKVLHNEFKNNTADGNKKKIQKGNAYVKGKIVDAITQKPLANVAVDFFFEKVLIAASCTDSTGEFMLINIPKVKGNLHAKKCGYKTVEVLGIEAIQGKTTYQDVGLIPIVEKKKKK